MTLLSPFCQRRCKLHQQVKLTQSNTDQHTQVISAQNHSAFVLMSSHFAGNKKTCSIIIRNKNIYFALLAKSFHFHPALQATRSLSLPSCFISSVSFYCILHCSWGPYQILSQAIHKTNTCTKVEKVLSLGIHGVG